MAVSAFKFTDPGYFAMREGTIHPENDTIVAVLVDNLHTPSITTDATYADISGNECADTDYTASFAEGLVVTGLAWSQTSSRNFKLDGAVRDYGNAVTISARYEYLVRRAGATLVPGDLILGFLDLNDGGAANVSSVAGNFDVDFNASGIMTETLTP